MTVPLRSRAATAFIWLVLTFTGVRCAHAQQPLLLNQFQEASQMSPRRQYEILRMELDVTGDGQPELLLGKADPTLPSGEMTWFMYQRIGDTAFRPLGNLDFSHLLFRVEATQPSRFRVIAPELGMAVVYEIDVSGVREVLRESLGDLDTADALRMWRQDVALQVLSASREEVVSQDVVMWRNLLDGADAIASSLRNLTVP